MDETIQLEAQLLHENVCQALADPKRIVILYLLADGPRNVTDLSEELDAPQSTVSRHLKVLRERSLVTAERDGKQIVYSIKDRRIIEALDLMRALVVSSLRDQGRMAESLAASRAGAAALADAGPSPT